MVASPNVCTGSTVTSSAGMYVGLRLLPMYHRQHVLKELAIDDTLTAVKKPGFGVFKFDAVF